MSEEKKLYPTSPDDKGFFYVNENEETQGILTKAYENGSETKMTILSNGSKAVIRKLRGRDFVETKKLVNGDNSLDFETANMATAVTIDGKQQPPEYYLDDLFQSDYALLMIAYGSLNFQ